MVSLPITIPNGATVLVKLGDSITHGQVLAKTSPVQEHAINVAELLRVAIKKVPSLLRIQQGDEVRVGDIIALRKNAFGMTIARLKSNVNGIILRFDEETGIVTIGNKAQKEFELLSPLAGVIQVCHNDQIVIQTNENILQGTGGVGGIARGELLVLSSMDPQDFLGELNGSIIDKIIFGHRFEREALVKAIGIGAVGIIATEIDPVDISYIQEKNLTVPVVLIDQTVLKPLVKQAHKEVFLEGTTYTILLLA